MDVRNNVCNQVWNDVKVIKGAKIRNRYNRNNQAPHVSKPYFDARVPVSIRLLVIVCSV